MASRSSGFTLIELLVVVAILGILAAIGIQSYSGYVSSTERKSAENILQQISLGQAEYYSAEGNYFSAAASDTNCTPSSASSNAIEQNLLGGADSISEKLNYEMCIDTHSSNYIVKAQKKNGSCEVTMTANSVFTRTNC